MKPINNLRCDELHSLLSPIEIEIIQHICKGHSSAEMAKSCIKVLEPLKDTGMLHPRKTGARNVAGLVFYAIEHGLVTVKAPIA